MNRRDKTKFTMILIIDLVIFFTIWIGVSALSSHPSIAAIGLIISFLFVMGIHVKMCQVWLKDYIEEFYGIEKEDTQV